MLLAAPYRPLRLRKTNDRFWREVDLVTAVVSCSFFALTCADQPLPHLDWRLDNQVMALMLVLPVLSIVGEYILMPGIALVVVVGKWFVFWIVGVRLLTAGLRQMLQPEFTARTVFAIEDTAAFTVVSELGISNLAIGVIAMASLYFREWTLPSAIYGLIFYGIAAIRHLRNGHRNVIETFATYSDLWAALVLAGYLAAAIITR